MELMSGYEDNYFDLAVVDPPYGIGIGNSVGGEKCAPINVYKTFDDTKIPDRKYFIELIRVSKNQVIWGGNYFIDHLRNTPCFIVWDKQNTGNFADCELAWTSFTTSTRKFTFRWNGMLQGEMKTKEKRIHPTQKPVRLYNWIFANYTQKEQRILDTHLGSGSSAIAAHYAKLDFVGCEIDKDYFKAASARIKQHTKQMEFSFAM
jgi:site-specific DNA-methyltransferase (adenine-specific)